MPSTLVMDITEVLNCRIWYSISRTMSDYYGIAITFMICSVRAFAVKPRGRASRLTTC